MQPIDYGKFVNNANPIGDLLGGVQKGMNIRSQFEQQKALQKKKEYEHSRRNDIFSTFQENPNAKTLVSLMAKYPEMQEKLEKMNQVLDPERKTTKARHLSQIYSALSKNESSFAIEKLEEQKEAALNSGDDQEAGVLQGMIDLIQINPKAAQAGVGMDLAATIGLDKFAENYETAEDQRRFSNEEGAKLEKVKADAEKAQTEAAYTESQIKQELAESGANVVKIYTEANLNTTENKIKNLELQIAQERREKGILSPEAEKKQLEVNKLKMEIDEKERKIKQGINSQVTMIDNTINSVEGLLNMPDKIWQEASGVWFNADSTFKKLSQDERNFANLIKELQSQITLQSVDLLDGPKSDADMVLLAKAVQAIDLEMDAPLLKSKVLEVKRLAMKNRKFLEDNYGIKLNAPDAPNSLPNEAQKNDLMTKFQRRVQARREQASN